MTRQGGEMADFRVVSENSEEDIKKREAEEALAWPYRELAANLLRVVRGAGSSARLMDQMAEVIQRSREYYDIIGHWPAAHTIDHILRIKTPDEQMEELLQNGRCSQKDLDRWENDGTMAVDRAVYRICRGALQKCASQLVAQTTQERTAENELHEGIRGLETARDTKRRR